MNELILVTRFITLSSTVLTKRVTQSFSMVWYILLMCHTFTNARPQGLRDTVYQYIHLKIRVVIINYNLQTALCQIYQQIKSNIS